MLNVVTRDYLDQPSSILHYALYYFWYLKLNIGGRGKRLFPTQYHHCTSPLLSPNWCQWWHQHTLMSMVVSIYETTGVAQSLLIIIFSRFGHEGITASFHLWYSARYRRVRVIQRQRQHQSLVCRCEVRGGRSLPSEIKESVIELLIH